MTEGLAARSDGMDAASGWRSGQQTRFVEIVPRELKKRLGASVTNDEAKLIVRRAVVQANEEIMSLAASRS